MFESGATQKKTANTVPSSSAAAGVNATQSDEIAASDYVLVVFVITIVVVSSLYFFLALIGELVRSCSHFLKVNRSRKKDKENLAKRVVEMWKRGAKTSRPRSLFSTENDDFEHNVNPFHSPSHRSASQASVASMRRFISVGSVSIDNPTCTRICGSDSQHSSTRESVVADASNESSETKSSASRANLECNEDVSTLVKRMSDRV